MSEKIEGIIESLKSLTLLEASELVEKIEEVLSNTKFEDAVSD